jgi:DUF1365 family protein
VNSPAETNASAIFVGRVRHRRLLPRAHAFTYRTQMFYLDLAELPRLFAGRWLWSVNRRNLYAWHRRDYLGDPAIDLDTAVRDAVAERCGTRPRGPIRMLTQLRSLGYCFNPVSIYYCFDESGRRVESILAEITNTPWGERHAYVVAPSLGAERSGDVLVQDFRKDFHVSPFMSMKQQYDWRFSTPGDRLVVHMQNFEDGQRCFDATLELERRPIRGASLAAAVLRHPFMTGKSIAAIYWQALRLKWKRIPFHSHPRHADPTV